MELVDYLEKNSNERRKWEWSQVEKRDLIFPNLSTNENLAFTWYQVHNDVLKAARDYLSEEVVTAEDKEKAEKVIYLSSGELERLRNHFPNIKKHSFYRE